MKYWGKKETPKTVKRILEEHWKAGGLMPVGLKLGQNIGLYGTLFSVFYWYCLCTWEWPGRITSPALSPRCFSTRPERDSLRQPPASTLGLKVSHVVHCAVAAVNTIPSADVWAAAICSCMEEKIPIHQSESRVTHVFWPRLQHHRWRLQEGRGGEEGGRAQHILGGVGTPVRTLPQVSQQL